MSTELIVFFIIGAVVALVVLLGVILAVARSRPRDADPAIGGGGPLPPPSATREPDATSRSRGSAPAGPGRSVGVLRVVWWLTIAGVLVAVGLSGDFIESQPLIYATGGAAVLVVVVFHELLPGLGRTPFTYWVETLAALVLASGLLVFTGYSESPFVFTLILIAVAVALARGGRPTFAVAVLAALAFVAVLALEPGRTALEGADLLRLGVNIGSIWLLAFLAAFFSGQERRMRSEMLQLSVTDPLTGLFNRAQIFSQLDQEIRRTRRSERGFCLLMVDLDGLKDVNDSLGHHRGDEVLSGLASVIRRSIRAVDSAYRYGGDEFQVLLPETDIVGAYVVAEKIRSGAEYLADARLEGAVTSVSIGLVSHPEDGSTVEELMIAADQAMYAAKSLGKNQISGYPRPRRIPPSLPVTGRSPTPVGPGPAVESARLDEPRRVETSGPGPAIDDDEGEADSATSAAMAHDGRTPPSRPNEPGPESDDFDPVEARRRIATLSYDPDHQIRRAMDAFLSAPPPRERREHHG